MEETKSIEPLIEVKPIVDVVPYNVDYEEALAKKSNGDELIFEYPTVYVISDKQTEQKQAKVPQFTVYVGETSDIGKRTRQHLDGDTKVREDWKKLKDSPNAEMMVVGDQYFNKSLTLDIENRLMMYLLSVDNIRHLNNRRTNPQRKYFMSDQFDAIFAGVWDALRDKKPELFPAQTDIESSAIFKASPFHALNATQLEGKSEIFNRVAHVLSNTKKVDNQEAAVIFIAGQAGTGKTVLLSNLFNDLVNSELTSHKGVNLLVNHDQQLIVYKQIANKLGLDRDNNDDVVCKPTHFINEHQKPGVKPADVILVDEAHLLWTHGKQAYRGQNQLQDLLKLAKVVIIVFDKYQILTTDEYLDNAAINHLEKVASRTGNTITLKDQERMVANPATIDWLHNLAIKQEVAPIPADEQYDLKVARTPTEVYQRIKTLDQNKGQAPASLARMLATFDWKYVDKKKPKDGKTWNVTVGDWQLPWNLQVPVSSKQKKQNKTLAWAEQPQTIDEIGSTYTIQGFDLNYAGLIIGPSVTYRDGRIVFDPSASMNKRATNNRTWKGQKINVAKELLRNELNVLLTRGVHGLYIYAVDQQLQQALLAAAGHEHILGEV